MTKKKLESQLKLLHTLAETYNVYLRAAKEPWDDNDGGGADFFQSGFHNLRCGLIFDTLGSARIEQRNHEKLKREAAVALRFAKQLQDIAKRAVPVLKALAKNGRHEPRKKPKARAKAKKG